MTDENDSGTQGLTISDSGFAEREATGRRPAGGRRRTAFVT